MTVKAIYENGIVRPTGPVDLPDKAQVEFEPKLFHDGQDDQAAQREIYQLLGQSFSSGERSVAERHDGHQP